MPTARLAQASDLERLLDLFRASEVSSTAQSPDRAEQIWSETLTRKGVAVFVSDEGAKIAATCMLITAPNLLRSGRGHAFLENVVTHPEFRGLGHGRAVVPVVSPKLGRMIATTSCFKAAAKILASIASMRKLWLRTGNSDRLCCAPSNIKVRFRSPCSPRSGENEVRFGRFCCKSQLRQAAKRDSVVLTRIAARSIHDGPSEE